MEIESHPFFENVSSTQRQKLIGYSIIEEYKPNVIIFEEGSNSDGIYLVLAGTVAFSKKLLRTHLELLVTLQPVIFLVKSGFSLGKHAHYKLNQKAS